MLPIVLFGLCGLVLTMPVCDPEPGTPANAPFGTGRGIAPGRVSWFYNRQACSWDGKTNYWWLPEYLNATEVDKMVEAVILSVSGLDKSGSASEAWDRLFKYFNLEHSGKATGYDPTEKIAIKINLNVVDGYDQTLLDNSISPQFVTSVIGQLVNEAGVPQSQITVFDASRAIPTIYWNPPSGFGTDFPNVNLRDNFGGMDYVKVAEPDLNTVMFFSDSTVPGWNITLLPKTVTEAKYVIQVDAFRGHDLAGITATGKNWFGSIYRQDLFCKFFDAKHPGHFCPASLHGFVNMTGPDFGAHYQWALPARPMKVYNPLVDLLGHDDLSAKGLIFLTDGLYSGIAEDPRGQSDAPIHFLMSPMKDDWSASAFASLDPIALDSVLFDFLKAEPNQPWPKVGCVDNYLHEGALADNPPSGVKYQPSGHPLKSLGCHEHWNNKNDMLYSRNMGKSAGIELIKVHDL